MVDTGFSVAAEKRSRLAKMYGRPDILTPAGRWHNTLALWAQGYNEAIDVSKTYPVDAPETFQRGGHGLFGTAADYLRFAQMLANSGELDGVRYLSRKTLQLMHSNHIPAGLFPMELGGFPIAGYGFGLGSRVALDAAATADYDFARRVWLGRRGENLLLGRSGRADRRHLHDAVHWQF